MSIYEYQVFGLCFNGVAFLNACSATSEYLQCLPGPARHDTDVARLTVIRDDCEKIRSELYTAVLLPLVAVLPPLMNMYEYGFPD